MSLAPEEEDLLDDEVTAQDQQVGIGIFRFRFRLANFRLTQGIWQRRFSIAEAAFLLMLAYLASRGLGVIRQSLFNALFGTNAESSTAASMRSTSACPISSSTS